MSIRTKIATAGALVTLCSSLLLGQSTAAALGAAVGEEDGRLLLVLDSSGSMDEPADDGQTKIAVAKQALRRVVTDLPGDAQVGMRVYGAEVFEGPRACTDTQLVVPIGPADKPALRAAIASYRPFGETPIAYSLRQAADDLGEAEGQRTILLVSDGEETCHPDPCLVARDIAGQGIDLKIDVVGLDVSGTARNQLRCIAEAGRGTYYDAGDVSELTASIDRLAVRAYRPFTVSGTPVEGTPNPEDAPELSPGQYSDVVRGEDTTRYYVLPRSTGSSVHAAVTLRPRSTGSGINTDGISLELLTPEGERCGYAQSARIDVLDLRSLVTTTVTYSPDSGSIDVYDEVGCARADRLVLAVSRGVPGVDIAPERSTVPVEMVVIEEPAVRDLATLPPPLEDPDPSRGRAATTDDTAPVVGGSSFSDAPTLEPGTYADTIRPGEVLLYRVRADWGQAPAMTFTVQPDSRLEGLTDALGLLVDVTAYGPDRTPVSLYGLSDVGLSNRAFYHYNQAASVDAALPQVRYRNRQSVSGEIKGASLAGYYYVAVQMALDDERQVWQAPLRIGVAVDGAVAGAPEYAAAVSTATPTPVPTDAASPLPTDAATPLPSDTSTPAETASAEAAPAEAAGSPAATDDVLPVSSVVVGGGLAAIALLAVLVALALRRSGHG